MTSNQKLLVMVLGVFSAILIASQFVMGQILVSAGGELKASVLKMHKHSGHLMVAVSLAYVFLTLWWVINSPTRRKTPGEPQSS